MYAVRYFGIFKLVQTIQNMCNSAKACSKRLIDSWLLERELQRKAIAFAIWRPSNCECHTVSVVERVLLLMLFATLVTGWESMYVAGSAGSVSLAAGSVSLAAEVCPASSTFSRNCFSLSSGTSKFSGL